MREFWERIDTGGRNKNNAKLFKLGEEFYPGTHDQHSSPGQTGWFSTRNSLHSDIPFQVGDEEDEEAYQQKKRMRKVREREMKRRRRYSSSSADETERSRGRKERNETNVITKKVCSHTVHSL